MSHHSAGKINTLPCDHYHLHNCTEMLSSNSYKLGCWSFSSTFWWTRLLNTMNSNQRIWKHISQTGIFLHVGVKIIKNHWRIITLKVFDQLWYDVYVLQGLRCMSHRNIQQKKAGGWNHMYNCLFKPEQYKKQHVPSQKGHLHSKLCCNQPLRSPLYLIDLENASGPRLKGVFREIWTFLRAIPVSTCPPKNSHTFDIFGFFIPDINPSGTKTLHWSSQTCDWKMSWP